MNTLLMDQQSDLDNFRTNLSREYGKNPPRMLIYIGAPAFIMRDFAEKEWGKGIPSIICAEEDFIGPDKYYVSKRAIPALRAHSAPGAERGIQSDRCSTPRSTSNRPSSCAPHGFQGR